MSHPRVIVLRAGTNDVGSRPPADEAAGNRLVDEVTGRLGAILDRMREKAPGATIILVGLFPRKTTRPLSPSSGGSTPAWRRSPTARGSATSTSAAGSPMRTAGCGRRSPATVFT